MRDNVFVMRQPMRMKICCLLGFLLFCLLWNPVSGFATVYLLDDFESGMANWNVSGAGQAGTSAHTFQSPDNSLYLRDRAVRVESGTLDISSQTVVNASLWVRRGADSFSEDPDSNEDLAIYYFNDSGSWRLLERFAGDGTPGEIYQRDYSLPADAFHSGFQLAMEKEGGSSGNWDYWHIDDVLIASGPSVDSIALASPDPAAANTAVEWTVEFSEPVTGVDLGDFSLEEGGAVTGSSLTAISGSGRLWTVTAVSGSADSGTLGLRLSDDDTIVNVDSVPLGGGGAGNGDYVGPVYTLQSSALTLTKVASSSAATIGGVVTFSISVSNQSPDSLTDVVVTDVLPAGMTYMTHVASDGAVAVSGQTMTWTLDTIEAGSSFQMTLAVSLTQQGPLVNTVVSPGATSASATVLVLGSAVTHFRMDEPVGSWTGTAAEVIDSGGTALHGRRVTSSPPTTSNVTDPSPSIASQHSTVLGSFCNAAEYDGNAVVQVADSVLLDYTTQLSASAWIYPTAYPPSELYSILSNDVNYEFHLNSSGHLYWWWQASTLTSSAVIPLNQWTHIAITLDSSSGVRRQRIYINGVQDSNTNNWQGTLATNNCNFHVGGDVATGSCDVINGRNFHGMIDEVKLYGFELSPEEVLADMNLGRSCAGTFDHIRIEHDGVASICAPESVTIKACMDSSCSALYPGDVTVNLSPNGWVNGGTFSFSGGIASHRLSVGTPGDVSLGTTSISPIPSMSTRCFDGSTETCTLNFAAASCAFDAVEPAGLPQSSLYTKLSGVPFDVDVLALLDATTLNSSYSGDVSVDLIDATGTACPTGSGLSTATTISFSPADAGRKTVTLDYAGAARDVRVRAIVGASAPACSTDNFAIRPQSILLSSTDATNTGLAGSTTIAAGDDFNLTATALPGYDGTPAIDASLLSGTPIAGLLAGSFPAASISTGIASGNAFTYSEVGHFGLAQYAVFDNDFTLVDQPDDCVPGYSNLPSGGKYGCSFGSQEIPQVAGSRGFGRFIPAYFDVNANVPLFDDACTGFTYLGQPFGYLIDPQLAFTAYNRAGEVTRNYGNQYWRMSSSLDSRSYVDNAVTASSLAVSTTGTSVWSETGDNDGDGLVLISDEVLVYSKPAAPEAAFNSNVDLVFTSSDLSDADGVCYDPDLDGNCNGLTISAITGGEQRYGRLLLQNAYGPETAPLTIPVLTEYFDGTAFVPNSLDSCTAYNALNLQLGNYQGNLVDGDTVASGAGNLISGLGNTLSLSAPGGGNDGSVDLTLDLSATGANLEWLQPGGNNPTARATFGIFRGNPRLIYTRESVW